MKTATRIADDLRTGASAAGHHSYNREVFKRVVREASSTKVIFMNELQ